MEECLLDDDKESVASENLTRPEATALSDVQTSMIENKREALSEGGGSDHAGEHHAETVVSTPELLNQAGNQLGNDQCTCGVQPAASTAENEAEQQR